MFDLDMGIYFYIDNLEIKFKSFMFGIWRWWYFSLVWIVVFVYFNVLLFGFGVDEDVVIDY